MLNIDFIRIRKKKFRNPGIQSESPILPGLLAGNSKVVQQVNHWGTSEIDHDIDDFHNNCEYKFTSQSLMKIGWVWKKPHGRG